MLGLHNNFCKKKKEVRNQDSFSMIILMKFQCMILLVMSATSEVAKKVWKIQA